MAHHNRLVEKRWAFGLRQGHSRHLLNQLHLPARILNFSLPGNAVIDPKPVPIRYHVPYLVALPRSQDHVALRGQKHFFRSQPYVSRIHLPPRFKTHTVHPQFLACSGPRYGRSITESSFPSLSFAPCFAALSRMRSPTAPVSGCVVCCGRRTAVTRSLFPCSRTLLRTLDKLDGDSIPLVFLGPLIASSKTLITHPRIEIPAFAAATRTAFPNSSGQSLIFKSMTVTLVTPVSQSCQAIFVTFVTTLTFVIFTFGIERAGKCATARGGWPGVDNFPRPTT